MELINNVIKNTGKNQLIALTCAVTLVTPYIIKLASGLVMNCVKK